MSKEQMPPMPPEAIEEELEKLRQAQNPRKCRWPPERREQPRISEEVPEWREDRDDK